jgi:hypothetical protein
MIFQRRAMHRRVFLCATPSGVLVHTIKPDYYRISRRIAVGALFVDLQNFGGPMLKTVPIYEDSETLRSKSC